jgi:hypothetical protein
MSSAIRYYGYAILVAAGLAGCTPAAFVQRARPPQPCEVQVCTSIGPGARCECRTTDQLVRQTRQGFWPHVE